MAQELKQRFSIQQLIGHGGVGHVYLGIDLVTDEQVAVKVLRPVFEDASDLLERFAREGEALSQLNHPNIVKVLDTFSDDGHHYIVMEYVPGGTLRDWLNRESRLPVEEVLKISLELADALTRAHHLHIIHRDLKPSNVLVALDGTPRLTDFGVARMGDHTRITKDGALTGTYAYLSPEACNGIPLDARADIWSLGVMMFEMLAGRRPFTSSKGAAVLMEIVTQPVPDLLQFRPDLPLPLTDLIHRMLSKDKNQRPSSIRLVGATLEAIMNGQYNSKSLSSINGQHLETPISTLTGQQMVFKHNLTPSSAPFIGREEELSQVKERLLDPLCRLVTILAPGGMGKTRLAMQVAIQLLTKFVDGVYFIPLASVTSSDFLISTIADHINLTFFEAGDSRASSQIPKDQLINYLSSKQILLVIDNFEHLLSGAGLMSELLQKAPGLKILVTSRERLNLRTEWVYRLDGMGIPPFATSPDEIDTYSAVQLFVQNARRVDREFSITAQNRFIIANICRMVEGMPLGIELAAMWVELLSPEEIAQEISQSFEFLETNMRDIPERHRSLYAVFESSWHLLTERERETLPKLSVFLGGFTRQTARRIANASLPVLSSLVNKSLLRRLALGEQKNILRYELHELLRQYVQERLTRFPELQQTTQTKYGVYFAEFLAERYERLQSATPKQALLEIEREIKNVRSAWQWAIATREQDAISQMSACLGLFYRLQNWLEEGKEIFGQAVQQFDNVAPESQLGLLRARFQTWFAEFSIGLGATEEPLHALTTSLQTFQKHGQTYDEADTLRLLGRLAGRGGQFAKGERLTRQSLTLYRQLDDGLQIANCLFFLGQLNNEQGNFKKARTLYQESLTLYRQLESNVGVADSLDLLGVISHRMGDHEATMRFAQESMTLYRELGSDEGMARAQRLLAVAATARGDYEEAHRLNLKSLAVYRKIGNRWGEGLLLNNLTHTSIYLGDYAAARAFGEQSLQILRETNNFWWIAYPLGNLGRACLRLGEYETAKQYFYEALDIVYESGAKPLVLENLLGLAEIILVQGHAQIAWAWLSLAMEHPALTGEVREQALLLKSKLVSELTEEESKQPVNLSLDDVVAEILATRL